MSTAIHLFLLGEFRLVSGDVPVSTLDRRLQSLLAYLGLHHIAPQARNHLAFLLWPDSPEAQAHTNLRNLLYKLRQALPEVDSLLHIERQTLQWQPTVPWTLDVCDFEHALAQAGRAAHARRPGEIQAALTSAVEGYQDDLLSGWYDEWVLMERERLRQRFLQALEHLLTLQEEERDPPAAIRTAQRLLRHDPLQETTYGRLMRLYAARGDRAAALRTYHACATALERELGVAPGPATREIYTRLLQAETFSDPVVPQPSGLRGRTPLVGRTSEWVQLQAAWQRTLAGRPQMVLLVGEAGMGKTRLAEELLAWVERQGIATASACAYEAEGEVPYAPVAAWLRTEALQRRLSTLADLWFSELTRLLPELLETRPALASPGLLESWQRQRFFEALARATLSTGQPLLLMLDDLHWCDRDTLEWLHYLLRFNPAAPLLLVGTARPEETGPLHPLTTLLASLRRSEQVTEIGLGPLRTAETTTLATLVADRELDQTWTERLYQETEGHPFFVVEAVRLAHEVAGTPRPHTAELPPSTIPPTVQTVIARRLESLSSPVRELASLAATIGRSFPLLVLAAASGSDEERLVQDLDELWRRRIVREQGAEAYDFSHEYLRTGALVTLSRARRRLLHQRVAEALVAVYADSLDQVSGQIAAHYMQANLPQQALGHLERAGDWAYGLAVHAEAERSYRDLVACLTGLKRDAERAQAQEKVARVLAVEARYPEALDTLEQSLRWFQATHDLEAQARVLAKIGQLKAAQGASEAGIARLTDWLASLPAGTLSAQSQGALMLTLANLFLNSERSREALAASQQAADCARQARNERLLGQAQWHLGRSLMLLGRIEEALQLFSAALPLAEGAGDLRTQCYVLLNLALLAETRGAFGEVKDYTEQALPLAERWGDPTLLAFLLTNHGFQAFLTGDWRRSRLDYERAITLLRQVGLPWGSAYPLLNLGLQLCAEGQEEAGHALLNESLATASRTQNREALRSAQNVLANEEILRGQPELARERLKPLVEEGEWEEPGMLSCLSSLAWAYLELGQTAQAQQLVDRVLAWAREQQQRLVLLDPVLPLYAQLAARAGLWSEAESALEEALTLAQTIPSRYDEIKILYIAGLIVLEQGKTAQARTDFEAAQAICLQLGERRYAARIKQALVECSPD